MTCEICKAREEAAIRDILRDVEIASTITTAEAMDVLARIGADPVADSKALRLFFLRLRAQRGINVAAAELLGMYEEGTR